MQHLIIRHPFLSFLRFLFTIADVAMIAGVIFLSGYDLYDTGNGLGFLGLAAGVSLAMLVQRAKDEECAANAALEVEGEKLATALEAEALEVAADQDLEPDADQDLEPDADQDLEAPDAATDENLEPEAVESLESAVRMIIANELLAEAFKMATNPSYFEFAPHERICALAVARELLELVESMSDRRAGVIV